MVYFCANKLRNQDEESDKDKDFQISKECMLETRN